MLSVIPTNAVVLWKFEIFGVDAVLEKEPFHGLCPNTFTTEFLVKSTDDAGHFTFLPMAEIIVADLEPNFPALLVALDENI